jgi:hypothetical protein
VHDWPRVREQVRSPAAQSLPDRAVNTVSNIRIRLWIVVDDRIIRPEATQDMQARLLERCRVDVDWVCAFATVELVQDVAVQECAQLVVVVHHMLPGGEQNGAGPQDSRALGDASAEIAEVMKGLVGIDEIERRVGKGKAFCERPQSDHVA